MKIANLSAEPLGKLHSWIPYDLGPFAYRDLDECLDLIKDYIEVVVRFGVIGHMGHLG